MATSPKPRVGKGETRNDANGFACQSGQGWVGIAAESERVRLGRFRIEHSVVWSSVQPVSMQPEMSHFRKNMESINDDLGKILQG